MLSPAGSPRPRAGSPPSAGRGGRGPRRTRLGRVPAPSRGSGTGRTRRGVGRSAATCGRGPVRSQRGVPCSAGDGGAGPAEEPGADWWRPRAAAALGPRAGLQGNPTLGGPGRRARPGRGWQAGLRCGGRALGAPGAAGARRPSVAAAPRQGRSRDPGGSAVSGEGASPGALRGWRGGLRVVPTPPGPAFCPPGSGAGRKFGARRARVRPGEGRVPALARAALAGRLQRPGGAGACCSGRNIGSNVGP